MNRYGLRIAPYGGTATNDYGLYVAATAQNYFAGRIGIGNTAPEGLLHVTGKVTGKALTILNETGNQAILTASASGVTKFTLNGIGTNPVASIAGMTSFAGLVVDNTVGDLFTASSSGLNRFVIIYSVNL